MKNKEDENARVKAEQKNRMDARAEAYEQQNAFKKEQEEKERDSVNR